MENPSNVPESSDEINKKVPPKYEVLRYQPRMEQKQAEAEDRKNDWRVLHSLDQTFNEDDQEKKDKQETGSSAKRAPSGQVWQDIDGHYWTKINDETWARGVGLEALHDGQPQLSNDHIEKVTKTVLRSPEAKEITPAKDAPIGQIRQDTDGRYWRKIDNNQWISGTQIPVQPDGTINMQNKHSLSDAHMDRVSKKAMSLPSEYLKIQWTKDAAQGQIREDVHGNYWRKAGDVWRSTNEDSEQFLNDEVIHRTTFKVEEKPNRFLLNNMLAHSKAEVDPGNIQSAQDAPIHQMRQDTYGDMWKKIEDNVWSRIHPEHKDFDSSLGDKLNDAAMQLNTREVVEPY